MNRRDSGFSLVELVFVIAIAAILMSIATVQFNKSMEKSAVESEATLIYSQLMAVRQEAMNMKVPRAVKIKPQKLEIFPSDVTTGSPSQSYDLKYTILSGAGPVSSSGKVISFDERGFTSSLTSVCVEPSGDTLKVNEGVHDSVVISGLRLRLGKRIGEGAECKDANIQLK